MRSTNFYVFIGIRYRLTNLTVIVPCDYEQTRQATIAIADFEGPVYLRFGRPVMPIFTSEEATFQIGKADILVEGADVTIIACGHMVWKAIEAVKALATSATTQVTLLGRRARASKTCA